MREGAGVVYGMDEFCSEGIGIAGGSGFSNKGFYIAGGSGC